MITISDIHHVTIDDKDEGHVIDAVRNNPTLAAEIKAAFDRWFIRHDSLCSAAIADAQAEAASARADADILGTKPEVAELKKARDIAMAQEIIAAQTAKITALRK